MSLKATKAVASHPCRTCGQLSTRRVCAVHDDAARRAQGNEARRAAYLAKVQPRKGTDA